MTRLIEQGETEGATDTGNTNVEHGFVTTDITDVVVPRPD